MREPCPNCGSKTLKIELEENRGVCGLCYEALSDPHNELWYPQSLETTVRKQE